MLASYVRQLDVQWVDATLSSLADTNDLELFATAARTIPLYHWMASQGSHVALILHLLPRVHILQLKPAAPISQRIPDVIDHVLEAHTTLMAALTSVRDITLETSQYAVSAPALLVLLKLPCIHSLHLPSAMDDFSAASDDMGVSTVTKLSFGSGTIDTPCLAQILALPCVLTHFSFVDNDGKRGSFNGVVFMAAMQRFRNTLQALELRFRSAMMKLCDSQPDEAGTLGDLRGWPVLRRLRCPFTLLLGRSRDVVLANILPDVLVELVLDPDGYCTYPQGLELVSEMLEGGRCRCLVRVSVAWPASVLLRSHMRRRMDLTSRGNALMTRLRVACRAAGVVLGQVSNGWTINEGLF